MQSKDVQNFPGEKKRKEKKEKKEKGRGKKKPKEDERCERRKLDPKLNGENFISRDQLHLTSLLQRCQIINVISLRERL